MVQTGAKLTKELGRVVPSETEFHDGKCQT
jgi:hypothetical protein